ncbi:GAF domain-containing SpoIIE family protein phosphatase [Kitasatospora sp. NPDC093102]|uniref:PP2C family protein-serine/threonine phosphatase n=1 Tax=Kitasatospora sp. NPDC093102 TaxID=3155069 RepID=UPI0034409213
MRQPSAADAAGAGEQADIDALQAQLRELARAQRRMSSLLQAVLAISRDLELPIVLRRIVTTAMDLVGARYGALGVLDEDGTRLADFIPAGLDEDERSRLAGTPLPAGRGLLGRLIHDPQPLRVDDIAVHPAAVGFPRGHPPMRTLLGVAITVRGRVYGNLYLADKHGDQPFDLDDEAVVSAMAGAAGVAIENARLYSRVRADSEHFQRLLLPTLPVLTPLATWASYQPATEPALLGGDWYDALALPNGTRVAVIGDVAGHDLDAAAIMAQTRNMLRAIAHDEATTPSEALARLDHAVHALPEVPMATVCLARLEPADGAWNLRWSNAGHLPPLLVTPDGTAHYLDSEPDLPIGVDPSLPRLDRTHPVPEGATLVLYTDGLVEHPAVSIDAGLRVVAETASAWAGRPLESLGKALIDARPGDPHDDLAVLALRIPGVT